MKLILSTGDIEVNPNVTRTISIELKENNNLEFNFENKSATLNQEEWINFYNQVSLRELTMWKLGRSPEPIGKFEFLALISEIKTNSQYQLFLALVDVAYKIDFPNIFTNNQFENLPRNYANLEENHALINTLLLYFQEKLSNKLISHDNSLYVLPINFYDITSPAIQELFIYNQLGKISIDYLFNSFIEFYYRPYFSPFAFRGELTDEAKRLLKLVENYKKRLL